MRSGGSRRSRSQASPGWPGEIEGASEGAGFFAERRQSWTMTAQVASDGASQVGKSSIIKYLSGGASFWFEWSQQSQRLATVGTTKRGHCRLPIDNC